MSETYFPENSQINFFKANDGRKIRYGYFPVHGTAKATVLLLSGHREFMEKYVEFIDDFHQCGMHVYSMDHRGQGLSERGLPDRNKSHNPDFDKIIDDIEHLVSVYIKPEKLDHPFFLVSHSLGSHFAIRYLHDHGKKIDKAVLLSPFSSLSPGNPMLLFLAKSFFLMMNGLGFGESFAPGQAKTPDMIDHEDAFSKLTHDRERYNISQKILTEKPDLFLGGVTYGWLKGAIKSLKKVSKKKYSTEIHTPVLCLMSGEEFIVDNEVTINFLKQMKHAEYDIIVGARHEMYRENDHIRNKLLERVFAFLSK